MAAVIAEYLGGAENMRLASGLKRHLILSAWDKVTDASRYTVSRYYKDGKLYITLNSSVLRTQLNFQKEEIRRNINNILREDELFPTKDTTEIVKTLIIK